MSIKNGMGTDGVAWLCEDGLWRIKPDDGLINARFFPIAPDGFLDGAQAERWWRSVDYYETCMMCGERFYSARADGVFCTPKCRAKHNRREQGASERAFTGAYHQRDESNRTHARRADTFEYQCEWCGKTNTARAEAQRAGKRAPSYCNDNGGACRQAAYRARRRAETTKSGSGQYVHRPPAPSPRAPGGEPEHTGRWVGQYDCVSFLADAYCYVEHTKTAPWNADDGKIAALAWAKRHLAKNHPDKTGIPASRLYKTISDCYSTLRKSRTFSRRA